MFKFSMHYRAFLKKLGKTEESPKLCNIFNFDSRNERIKFKKKFKRNWMKFQKNDIGGIFGRGRRLNKLLKKLKD